jgi:hypothetical protein
MPVPFLRTQWGLGTSFQCKACGSEIIVPKAKQATAFGLYVLGTAFAKSMGFVVALALFAIGMVLSWPLATVRLIRRAPTNAAPPAASLTQEL